MATEPRPTLDEVAALLESSDVVPVVVEIPTGSLTPVEAMHALGIDGPCFLLESAEGREPWAEGAGLDPEQRAAPSHRAGPGS